MIGIREARAVLGELVRAARKGEQVVLTERGTPAVVLVTVDDDDLSLSPAFVAELHRRLAAPKSTTVRHEQLVAELEGESAAAKATLRKRRRGRTSAA